MAVSKLSTTSMRREQACLNATPRKVELELKLDLQAAMRATGARVTTEGGTEVGVGAGAGAEGAGAAAAAVEEEVAAEPKESVEKADEGKKGAKGDKKGAKEAKVSGAGSTYC